MQNLIYPLLVAIISGLTVVAYKNPIFYEEKFANKLFIISLCGIWVDGLWTIAIKMSFSSLKDFIPKADIEKAKESLTNIYLPENTFYWFVALMVFTFFLSWLAFQRKYKK